MTIDNSGEFQTQQYGKPFVPEVPFPGKGSVKYEKKIAAAAGGLPPPPPPGGPKDGPIGGVFDNNDGAKYKDALKEDLMKLDNKYGDNKKGEEYSDNDLKKIREEIQTKVDLKPKGIDLNKIDKYKI